MVKILIKKLDTAVKVPEYKTDGASGMDLIAFLKQPINVKPKTSSLVPTGLSVAFSKEYEIQIRPRSGLAAKNNISVLNTPGTIDSDYRGEISAMLINHSKVNFEIERGMRIAQMVIAPVVQFNLIKTETLDETKRGAGGFGSTGISAEDECKWFH